MVVSGGGIAGGGWEGTGGGGGSWGVGALGGLGEGRGSGVCGFGRFLACVGGIFSRLCLMAFTRLIIWASFFCGGVLTFCCNLVKIFAAVINW